MKTLWFALSTLLLAAAALPALAATEPTDVQSPHPYPNNLDELYYLAAPEGAQAFEIHFAWVDLEANYDYLYVLDGDGDVVETLTGFRNDFTVYVEGHQAMLRLVTDYSVRRDGFVVDALIYDPGCICPTIWAPVCGEDGQTYGSTCWAACDGVGVLYVGECLWHQVDLVVETPHPYANDYDLEYTVQAPEPTTLYELQFEDIDTEQGYDFLRISNLGRLVAALSGDLGAQVVEVPFDEARLHFTSDYSVTDWGFRMTGYRYLDLDGVDDACVPEGAFAGPADVCCGDLAKVKDCLPDEDCPRHEYWCVACGNGTCDEHENWSTCPDDCEPPPVPDCIPTGCSGEICAEEHQYSSCEWLPHYACYQEEIAVCAYDVVAGECAWMDAEPGSLELCLDEMGMGGQLGETCGTILGLTCNPGLICNYAGDYPDAGGTCELEASWHTRLVDVQTPHPYANDLYEEYEITVVGAERIRAHFSDFATEYSYDGVTLQGPWTWWTGDLGAFWTDEVEGDTLVFELETDYSITDWGFSIDKVEYYR